jgi:hypothetical protein
MMPSAVHSSTCAPVAHRTRRVAPRLALAAALGVCVVASARAGAQPPAERRRDVAVSPSARDSVIGQIITLVRRNYADSTAGQRMAGALERRWRAGEYSRLDSAAGLVGALSSHLQAVQADAHLRVDYFVVPRPMRAPAGTAAQENIEARRRMAARRSFGFERVERLPGNVAFVNLRTFEPTSIGKPALDAAMQLASGADALILDLRQNGGGYGDMVGAILAYFLAAGTATSDGYDRPSGRTTRATVPARPGGPIFQSTPLFILTSRRTFSAAEALAYTLQARGRATIVGETTRGGANPVQVFQLSPHFALFLPTGRVTDLVTRANWEGSGVSPDVPTDAAGAFTAAYRRALELLLARASDADARDEIQDALARISAPARGAP